MRTLFVSQALVLSLISSVYAGEIQVQVTDSAGKPVENAVVYAEAANKTITQPPVATAISQKNRRFIPLITVVQTGASITFPNNDTVRHHVYSFSPAKTFELKLYSGKPSSPIIFDKPGIVVLGCNIHDTMIAYINVVDTPYFGKTDADGKVTIKDTPNGQYTLKTWHYAFVKENAVIEQTLNVKGAEELAVKVNINPDAIIAN